MSYRESGWVGGQAFFLDAVAAEVDPFAFLFVPTATLPLNGTSSLRRSTPFHPLSHAVRHCIGALHRQAPMASIQSARARAPYANVHARAHAVHRHAHARARTRADTHGRDRHRATCLYRSRSQSCRRPHCSCQRRPRRSRSPAATAAHVAKRRNMSQASTTCCRVHTRTHACTHSRMHARMQTHTHTHTHPRARTHARTRMHARTHALHTNAPKCPRHTHTHTLTPTHRHEPGGTVLVYGGGTLSGFRSSGVINLFIVKNVNLARLNTCGTPQHAGRGTPQHAGRNRQHSTATLTQHVGHNTQHASDN